MRTSRLLAAALVISLGCNFSASSGSSPPSNPDPSAGKPIEQAESTEKPLEKPKPDPKAEAQTRFETAMAELEAEYKTEAARWTPELKAATAKLTATKWRTMQQGMTAALAGEHRRPGHAARDPFRHPKETMTFFGLKPTMNVFEVGPGAGWWSELLAVVLSAKGKLAMATYDSKSDDHMTKYFARGMELLLDTAPELYGKVERVQNSAPGAFEFGAEGSRDMILVMRMTHNVIRTNGLDKFLASAHAALKPGGILAIEQHRAADGADPAQSATKGYVPQAWLIEQVEAAGFKLAAKSEINANPKDTKDYEKGVWTLPPNFAEGDKDKAKFEAIGESDRMTLKFVKTKTKPKTPAATGDIKAKPETTHDKPKVTPKPSETPKAKPVEDPREKPVLAPK